MNTASDTLETNTPKSPGGMAVGQSAADLVGFYGAAPIAQRAGAAQAAVATTGATSTTPFGYTEAQANAIIALLNEIRAALVAVGIIKGAA
jgi:hypothetical protein